MPLHTHKSKGRLRHTHTLTRIHTHTHSTEHRAPAHLYTARTLLVCIGHWSILIASVCVRVCACVSYTLQVTKEGKGTMLTSQTGGLMARAQRQTISGRPTHSPAQQDPAMQQRTHTHMQRHTQVHHHRDCRQPLAPPIPTTPPPHTT